MGSSLLRPKEKNRESFGGRSWETMAAVEGAGSPIVRLALGYKAREEGSEMRETGGLEPLAFWPRRRRWEIGERRFVCGC